MVALHRLLSRLDAHRRVLVIGAHPDDEDTALLALVARGMGGEAAYLSLSRGEGGQNLIGPELGEELGLIRTQELMAARGVDGARQFFTRAFDFGYTRSLDETLEKWPKEAILEDTVRVVRRFKPQVIVSIFPTTADAGHGQHQEAGVAAHEVFAASADAARFAAGGRPAAVARVGALPLELLSSDRRQPDARHRHHRPGQRQDLLPARDGVAQHAPLAGHGRAAGPRAARDARRRGSPALAPRPPAGEGAPESRPPARGSGGNPFQAPGPGTQPATVPCGDLFAGVDTRLRAIADALDAGPERDALAASLDSRLGAKWRRCAASWRRVVSTRPSPRLREVVELLEAASRRLASAPIDRRPAHGGGRSGRARSSSSRAKRWRSRRTGCSTPTPSRRL